MIHDRYKQTLEFIYRYTCIAVPVTLCAECSHVEYVATR